MTPTPSIFPSPTAEVLEEANLVASFLTGTLAVLVALFGLWLIAFIDILKAEFKEKSNKIIWLLVTFFLPVLGPILYFLVGRNQIKKGTGINLKSTFTIAAFIVWFPLGVVLMWIWTKWPNWLKIVLTIIGILLTLPTIVTWLGR